MNEKKQITFKYVFPDNYNPVYSNGAFGGISAQGELIINFFLERSPIPSSVTNVINADGSLGEIVALDPETEKETILRYVSADVVVNEERARALYAWIGNQLQELENRKKLANPQ